MNSQENCRDRGERRRLIRERARDAGSNEPNGIDYVEVGGDQRVVTVYFLNKAPRDITARNVRVAGGVRVRDIRVEEITLCEVDDPDLDDCMRVEVDRPGDFSTYTLELVSERGGPLEGFDPRYSRIDFSFKAGCPSDIDCAPAPDCHEEPGPEPDIDYLARDYASFRQLIFDRLSLVMPDWRERHVPDLGVALVELFAYVGDYLSYYQDAVATEAYFDTARLRVSVRRHALLVDYPMHEGCNARAWVAVNVGGDVTLERPDGFYFITDPGRGLPTSRPLTTLDLTGAAASSYEVFEPLTPARGGAPFRLYEAHNEIKFYTWHDSECCLPRGATSATLLDSWRERRPQPPPIHPPDEVTPPVQQQAPAEGGATAHEEDADQPVQLGKPERYDAGGGKSAARVSQSRGAQKSQPKYQLQTQTQTQAAQGQSGATHVGRRERRLRLKVGDVLIFEEVKGPKTGSWADADKSHRHAVRLTHVEQTFDPLDDTPVVYVEWDALDALPFPLCISSIGEPPGCELIEDVSVARGNVILADHGRTVGPEDLPVVPEGRGARQVCEGPFEPGETFPAPGRFRPTLRLGPLTHSTRFPAASQLTRAQVILLSGLLEEVRRRVERLRREAEGGDALTREELEEVAIIFGRKAAARAGLSLPAPRERKPQQGAGEQSEALGRLLARFDDHLRAKARRVESLRERSFGGYVMTADERGEIAEMFGRPVADAALALLDARSLGPASAALAQEPREALPSVRLCHLPAADDEMRKHLGDERGCWEARRSLLESGARERHFVAEMDDEGRAHLRLGDGENGRAPEPDDRLRATYRIGNGPAGNVGADSIAYVVFRDNFEGVTMAARNPLPARGGASPESVADVKALAPGAVRKDLQRAVIAEDYARLAERGRPDKVQRAAADISWAGSWYEMRTHLDPRGSESPSPALLSEVEGSLHRYRRIGHDLSTAGARYVPLDVGLQVCVKPHYLRGHVRAALAEVFSNRALAGGRRGLFHPDQLSFGEGVFLSRLVAAAQSVEGVESVRVTRLQRLHEGPRGELEGGVLALGPLEVAQLDNDPNYPERGVLALDLRGGR